MAGVMGIAVALSMGGGAAALDRGAAKAPAAGRVSTPLGADTATSAKREASYVASVRRASTAANVNRMSDAALVDFATAACAAIDAGNPASIFRQHAELMEIPDDDYRSVLRLAEAYYCPKHIGFTY